MSVQTILPSAKKLMLLLALAFTQLQAQDLAHYKRVEGISESRRE